MNLADLIHHVVADYGPVGGVGLALAGVVLLVIAFKVTKFIVKLVCWVLFVLALAALGSWVYLNFVQPQLQHPDPGHHPATNAPISRTVAAPVSPRQ